MRHGSKLRRPVHCFSLTDGQPRTDKLCASDASFDRLLPGWLSSGSGRDLPATLKAYSLFFVTDKNACCHNFYANRRRLSSGFFSLRKYILLDGNGSDCPCSPTRNSVAQPMKIAKTKKYGNSIRPQTPFLLGQVQQRRLLGPSGHELPHAQPSFHLDPFQDGLSIT